MGERERGPVVGHWRTLSRCHRLATTLSLLATAITPVRAPCALGVVNLGPSGVLSYFSQVHAAIRAKPVQPKKARTKPAQKKHFKEVKLTYEQRKANLKEKLATLMEDE